MDVALPVGTTLYRATDRSTCKPAVLAGLGAFHGLQAGGPVQRLPTEDGLHGE
jgi:hypothetical protein